MENKELLTVTLIAGLFFIAGMTAVIVGILVNFKKRKKIQEQEHEMMLSQKEVEKVREIVNSQSQEREKLAHDLHDEIGALISMAQRQIKGLIHETQDEDMAKELETISEFMHLSIHNLRRVSQNLLPHFLVKFGWHRTMQRLSEQISSGGVTCIYQNVEEIAVPMIMQNQILLYYIIMELTNNLLKHAQASEIQLILDLNSQFLTMEISHNGNALDQLAYEELLRQAQGVGLQSIAQRILLLRANIYFRKLALGGQIQIEIPIEPS